MPDADWLDGSKIADLHLCPRKFYRRHEQHLVPKVEGLQSYANAAQFGTALHAGLACLYSGDGMVQDTCPCPGLSCEYCRGGRIPRVLARFLVNYPVDPKEDPDSRRRDPRTRDNGIEILKQYIRKYLVESKERFTVVGVELAFELEFNNGEGELEFHYVGRIDLLVTEDGKTLEPWDHKSSTMIGNEHWVSGWKLNHSMTGYMYSTHKFTEIPCVTGVINGVKVTAKIEDKSFERITTTRSEEEFREWEKEVWNAYALILMYRKNKFWPKHSPYACSAYFKQCDYYNLCCASGNAEMEKNIIEANFEEVEWHPFHGVE
jgi:hypothetical protein